MSFIYPQFLFGLFALGIPIIVHLFNFRRAKKIYFSNNLLLLNIKNASNTRYKLKQYLILLSRLLFILFLVFTFAQPFIPADEKSSQSNQITIYLDNSFSMSNSSDEEHSAYEVALHHLESIISIYPQNTEITLITNEFAPFSNKPKNKHEISELLTEISLTGISRSTNDILRRINRGEINSRGTDIYWLSDFQQTSFNDIEKIISDTLNNHFLIPIPFLRTSNVYVDSLYLSNPFLIQGEKNELNVVLRNDGDQEVTEMLIKFYLNGLQSANGSIDINPFSTTTISFDIGIQLDKFNSGSISFEDFPVSFDNDFYFSLALADRIIINEIKSTDSTTVIEKVFGNTNLFDFNSFNKNNVDYNALINSNLIVLNGIDQLEETLKSLIMDYSSNSGDLIVIPSSMPMTINNESFIFPFEIFTDTLASFLPMANIDLENPFFSEMFESKTNTFEMPGAIPTILPLGTNEDLLRFRDGRKFLSVYNRKNKVYVLACPIDKEHTNFSSHALFVPIMYRIATLSKREFNRLYYLLNENIIAISLDSINRNGIIKLSNNEKELIPGYRVAGNELFLEIPKFELGSGLYSLNISEQFKGTIAFNESNSESRLEQIPIENLQSITGENSRINLFKTKGIDNFDKVIKEKYLGIQLWRYTLILALIFLLLEILLIRFL